MPTPTGAGDYGLQSHHQPVVRRRYGDGGRVVGAQRARRRRAARRRLDARPVRRRDRRRPALRPRRGGQQERLRDLHLRACARSSRWARRSHGGVELHFTYDEEFGGELGPGWLLERRA